jgi:hypothetical protein
MWYTNITITKLLGGTYQEHERPVYFYSHYPVIFFNSTRTVLNSNLSCSYRNRVDRMYINCTQNYPRLHLTFLDSRVVILKLDPASESAGRLATAQNFCSTKAENLHC